MTWDELAKLEPDWDSYGAEPPNENAIETAKTVVATCIYYLNPSGIIPSAEGGVGICFFGTNHYYADIECYNSGEILCCTSDGTGNPSVWETHLEEIEEAAKRIQQFLLEAA